MNWFFRWLFKLSAGLPGLLIFRPKIYQSDKQKRTKHIKGKAIIIANHKNVSDFFVIYLIFFFKRVRTLVSELLYRHKFVAWLSKVFAGNILVHRERSDLSFMAECEKRLSKGDNICIFPEGRFVQGDELGEFKPAAVYLALRTNTPIVPVYISHDGPKHMKRVNIGEPIDLSLYCNEKIPSPEKVKELCEMLRKKVIELGHQMNMYRKYHVYDTFNGHHFVFDFIRTVLWSAKWLVFPVKRHYEEGATRKVDYRFKGRALVAGKHNGMTDAPILICDYMNRRLRVIVAKEAYEKIKVLKRFGAIKYNRVDGQIDAKLMLDVINILKCNGAVGIYPEGHCYNGHVGDFAAGLAYFSILTNTPIYINIPLHEYKPFRRNHVMIGKRLVPSEIYTPEQLKEKATINEFSELIHNKFVTLYEELKTYEKSKK